jgi:hypothetical protein
MSTGDPGVGIRCHFEYAQPLFGGCLRIHVEGAAKQGVCEL